MKTIDSTTGDSTTWKKWVDQDLEGELLGPEKERLEEVQAVDAGARAERRALSSLHRMFAAGRVAVRGGFQARVMAALRPAWWEERRASSQPAWALPVAAMLFLGMGAALTLGRIDATGDAGRFMGLGLALLDFGQTTFLAGSGMLLATWRGVGFGLEQVIGDSGTHLLALAALVFFLDLLFIAMLRRPRKVEAKAESAESGS